MSRRIPGSQRVETAGRIEAGGQPVIIIFVDTDEHVDRVLPTLKGMPKRLIVRKNVGLEQRILD